MGDGGGLEVLVVEDDDRVRLATVRALARSARGLRVGGVATVREAMRAAHAALVGAVIDVGLPDGDGLTLLSMLRQRAPAVRVLVMTGDHASWIANEAALLDAVVTRKPDTGRNLAAFAARLTRTSQRTELSKRATAVLARSSRLSPQGGRIVELMAQGVRRDQLAAALGVDETTVRSHVRQILTRTGIDRADRIAWRLLRICDDLGSGPGLLPEDEEQGPG